MSERREDEKAKKKMENRNDWAGKTISCHNILKPTVGVA